MTRFLAFDFETATPKSDSACAIGLVRVEDGKIVKEEAHLIRPPTPEFWFTYIHGIAWKDVKDSPHFGEVWPKIEELFRGIDFVVAHNVGFDLRVLKGCSERYGLAIPQFSSECTVQIARQVWNLYPTKLPNVCQHLGIELNHHEALSDARACAKIMIKALETGLNSGAVERRLL